MKQKMFIWDQRLAIQSTQIPVAFLNSVPLETKSQGLLKAKEEVCITKNFN